MTSKEKIPETGDKCTRCAGGRVALVSSMIYEGAMDDEPYTDGIKEGDNETITFDEFVTVVTHTCDTCGHIYAAFIE